MNERKPFDPLPLVAAAALGALAMYLLDPQRGRGRVAALRDQAARLGRRAAGASGRQGRHLANRGRGVLARLRRRMDAPPPDRVLVERVRARLGRLASHPHAIGVSAYAGLVTLQGPVLREEAERLVQGVRGVMGVSEVESRLELHDSAAGVPALQGPARRAAL